MTTRQTLNRRADYAASCRLQFLNAIRFGMPMRWQHRIARRYLKAARLADKTAARMIEERGY